MFSGGAKSKKDSVDDEQDKLHKFCNIIRYIEHEDEKLFRVIYNLCLFPGFGSKKGCGVTFLFPRGEFRSQIIKDAYSANVKDAYTAINACIIKTHIPEIGYFLTAGKLINNNCDEIKIVDSSKTTVTFDSGIKIEKDINFQLLHSNAKYAVYNIVSGTPALGKPKMSLQSSTSLTGSYKGGASKDDMEYLKANPSEDGDIRNSVLKLMHFAETTQLKNAKPGKTAPSKFVSDTDSLLSNAKDQDNSFETYADQIPVHYWCSPFLVAWVVPMSTTG
jgi:hypothetical protein